MSPNSDTSPAESPLAADIPCAHCHYNLRTLLPSARCPECGQSVADSVALYVRAEAFTDLPRSAPLAIGAAFLAAYSALVLIAIFVVDPARYVLAKPLYLAGAGYADNPAPSALAGLAGAALLPLAALLFASARAPRHAAARPWTLPVAFLLGAFVALTLWLHIDRHSPASSSWAALFRRPEIHAAATAVLLTLLYAAREVTSAFAAQIRSRALRRAAFAWFVFGGVPLAIQLAWQGTAIFMRLARLDPNATGNFESARDFFAMPLSLCVHLGTLVCCLTIALIALKQMHPPQSPPPTG